MFPGYVFVETSMDTYDFLNYVKNLRRTIVNPIKVLKYGDSNEIALKWEERLPLMNLMNHEWCIKTSVGFKENEKIKIIAGPLIGHEGKINKIDRYKMRAWVEIDMLGRKSLYELGMQMIK